MPREFTLYWPYPEVQFNGVGISQTWAGYMHKLGFSFSENPEFADCAVFSSDSVLDERAIDRIPTIAYFWGWHPGSVLDAEQVLLHKRKIALMKQCTRVLVPGLTTQAQTLDFGIASDVLVPGVDTELLNLAPPATAKKPQIMFLSRLAEHKGLEYLINAMQGLRGVQLLVCGPGDRTRYQELADRLEIDVEFKEPSDEEKLVHIRESMVLVHPSTYEGFGLPPLEALYLGTPVIAADTPQMRWLLRDAALYFDNVNELSNKLLQVLNHPDSVLEKTLIGQHRVRNYLNLDRASRDLAEQIHEAVRTFCGRKMRENPEKAEEVYNLDHKRNFFFKAQYFDPTWSRHWRAQEFMKRLSEHEAQDILDVGSGPVYPTIFAMNGYSVTAFDISNECLDQVVEVATNYLDHKTAGKLTTQQGRAQELPFADSSFEGVVLGEILEHVENPELVLSEAFRVSKKVVIASTPIGHHHWDPLHIASDEGGWSTESISELLEPYIGRYKLYQIAEQGTDPSCFLFVINKKFA
jgi:2-polyprenyl-3-methyl-5-hydroxy-6-metoxy-1,4-benzoquinol methylase